MSLANVINLEEIIKIVEKYFIVRNFVTYVNYIELTVIPTDDLRESFRKLYTDLVKKSLFPFLVKVGDELRIRVQIGGEKKRRIKLQIMLFIATIATTIITAYFWVNHYVNFISENLGISYSVFDYIVAITLFTLGVLISLGLHEIGHFIASKKVKVPVSLPYFIPAPPVISLGTFGAVINMRFLPSTPDELAFVGISGPLFGILFSAITSVIGLHLSQPVPLNVFESLVQEGKVEVINFSTPLYSLLFRAIWGSTPVLLHPIAQVGLLLLIIHFLNLLPIGQLDGGHVIRGITSMRIHYFMGSVVATLGILSALLIRSFITQLILIFSFLALFLSGFRPHLGFANQLAKPTWRAYVAFSLYLILLALTFPIIE